MYFVNIIDFDYQSAINYIANYLQYLNSNIINLNA